MKTVKKPFLTRFFRVWAEDIRIPNAKPPLPRCKPDSKADPKKIQKKI